MKNFIPISNIIKKQKLVSETKIDAFIDKFNMSIENDVFFINTALDNFLNLTEDEFNLVRESAQKQGYTLIRFEDENNSITYKIAINILGNN